MTERAALPWRWASEHSRRRFRSRARAMGTFQPFPMETRRRYRDHVFAAIEEIARYPEAAPLTEDKAFRVKTIASTGTAQGDVILYQHSSGVVVIFGVFAALPAGFLAAGRTTTS